MPEGYKILYQGGTGELEEKKSRFIASAQPVESEEEAAAFIEAVKKKYWDARHNCYAYVIGEKNQIQRCSDDGEPSQTAGKPILEVLLGEGIHNACVVVTRYFGGTLLGTGGLVRAYAGAAKEAVHNSRSAEKRRGRRMAVRTDYNGLGKIRRLAEQMGISILDTLYTESVEIALLVPEEEAEAVKKKVTEAVNGRCQVDDTQKVSYGILEKEVVLF